VEVWRCGRRFENVQIGKFGDDVSVFNCNGALGLGFSKTT
jgi:hypothetical protein